MNTPRRNTAAIAISTTTVTPAMAATVRVGTSLSNIDTDMLGSAVGSSMSGTETFLLLTSAKMTSHAE